MVLARIPFLEIVFLVSVSVLNAERITDSITPPLTPFPYPAPTPALSPPISSLPIPPPLPLPSPSPSLPPPPPPARVSVDPVSSSRNMTVLVIIQPPFSMYDPQKTGNDAFSGFIVDLFEEVPSYLPLTIRLTLLYPGGNKPRKRLHLQEV